MIRFEWVSRLRDQATADSNEVSNLKLPERSTKNAAGYDFYNPEKVTIKPGEIVYVKTGVKAEMPEYLVLLLFNRSSNPKKKGLEMPNGVGVVDADYYNNSDNEGEMAFAFRNTTDKDVVLEQGEKLGQGVFVRWFKTNDDNETDNVREGGFGSTGK